MRRRKPTLPPRAEASPAPRAQHLGGWLVLPGEVRPGRLTFRQRLEAITPLPERELLARSGNKRYILAGFIDTHVHGGGGGDTMDGLEGLQTMCKFHAAHGTTSLLPTTITAPWPRVTAALEMVARLRDMQRENQPPRGLRRTAQVLGAHLEGPFISPQRLGAQPAQTLEPTPEQVQELLRLDVLRAVTLAPEVRGAAQAAQTLARAGVRIGVGHTRSRAGAMWAFLEQLAPLGKVAATHLFNAMGGITAREPGIAGALLAHPAPFYELIADLQHVHPLNLRLVHSLAPDRFVLVTDAMRATGMPGGASELGGQAVTVREGRATLADGTLAGSVLTMDAGVRHLVQAAGFTLPQASRAASANPARSLGLHDRGELRVGGRADLVVLDEDLKVLDVYIAGERLERA